MRERARRLAAELDPEDPDDAIVRRVAFAEVDRSNLLGALRLRAARALGEAGEAAVRWAEESHVPGGRLGVALLDRLARAPTRADAHGELRETAPALWQPALERWRSDGDLPALDVGLRRASALRALALHYTTDPAGVGVPVAYAWAKQLEADNLRQIGLARLRGLTPEQVRERLVIG